MAEARGSNPLSSTIAIDLRGRNSYTLGMKSTVSEKGQVTIPKKLRDRLGIQPGAVLDFVEVDGRLVATKTMAEDVVAAVSGLLESDGMNTDQFIENLRGNVLPKEITP